MAQTGARPAYAPKVAPRADEGACSASADQPPSSPPPSPPHRNSGGLPGERAGSSGLPTLEEDGDSILPGLSGNSGHMGALAALSGGSSAGGSGGGASQLGTACAVMGAAQKMRKGGGKRNWKANLQSRHILEMPGSMVGISDPFQGKPSVSPYVVTAIKQSEIFVLPQAPLKAVLNLMPFDESNVLAATVQAQFNKLCKQLKASELVSDSVEKRKEEVRAFSLSPFVATLSPRLRLLN